MEKTFKTILASFIAIACLSLAGCEEDNPTPAQNNNGNNGNNNNNPIELAGTAWVGKYKIGRAHV